MLFAIVAGEASGDLLGAGLIQALRERVPDAQFEGVAGAQMRAAGCHALYSVEELSVMGLVEVLRHLPRLLRLRTDLARHFRATRPDVFIGIDAPDFNLGLERRLKRAGIPTVHYVSPSVWAWRRGRLRGIARAVDLMLTLFPFESAFYREHGLHERCIGHPLADSIAEHSDRTAARAALDLATDGALVALLPGSRCGELRYLAEPFLRTGLWLRERRPALRFAAPLATPATRLLFEQIRRRVAPDLPVTIIEGRAHEVMAAADVVLVASGTATLEAMLLKRPMVMAYRLSGFSHWLLKRLVRTPYFALPNLLAQRLLVPEFIQDNVTPEHLGQALLDYLDSPERVMELEQAFTVIHHDLRRDASRQAAQAVLELVRGTEPTEFAEQQKKETLAANKRV